MTRAVENIERLLKKTRLIRPGEDFAELMALEEGFKLVEEAADRLEGDLLLMTASEQELSRRENLFRPGHSTADCQTRREMLMTRENAAEGCVSLSELSKLLEAAGVRGELMEKQDVQSAEGTVKGIEIRISELLGISRREAELELEALMPAHLLRNEIFPS